MRCLQALGEWQRLGEISERMWAATSPPSPLPHRLSPSKKSSVNTLNVNDMNERKTNGIVNSNPEGIRPTIARHAASTCLNLGRWEVIYFIINQFTFC